MASKLPGALLKSGCDMGLGAVSFSQVPSWLLVLSSCKEKAWISFHLNFLPFLCALVFLLLGVSDTCLLQWLLVFATKTHCLACSQNDLCKVKIWACQHTVEVPLVDPSVYLRILVWPICQSGFILPHLCIFQLRGLSSLIDAHVAPITGLWHTWFPLMLHSSASLPLTTTSDLSSSATCSENCSRLPCSVTFCLGLFCHCLSPLVSSWGPEARNWEI